MPDHRPGPGRSEKQLMCSFDREQSLRLLEQYHQFPGLYSFKIIGPARPEWAELVRQAAQSVLGDIGDGLRPSRQSGQYQSLELHTPVVSAAQVLEVYAVLQKLPEVKMLM